MDTEDKSFHLESLNFERRKAHVRRIDNENNQMLKRLESLESNVSKKKLGSEWQNVKKYRELVSRASRMQGEDVARKRNRYLERNQYHSFLSPTPG